MQNQRRSTTQILISTVIPILALMFSLFAMWLWYTESNEDRIDTLPSADPDAAFVHEANIVLNRANDAVNSAELILSFLEGASVIITIVIAGAAVVGLSGINELREAVDETERELVKRVEDAESRLIEREKQLANMEDLLAEAQVRIDRLVDERLQRVYADTESARRQSAALARFSVAEQLMRNKNLDSALIACQEAYELDPDNYANNYLYGTLLIEKGDYEAAIKRLEEALAVDSDFTPAIAALGLANRRAGDLISDRQRRNELYNIAEARLLEAINRDQGLLTPDGESFCGTLGSLYRRQGRTEDALDSYRRAAEITPQRSYPYVNLAMLYMALGEEQLRDQNLVIAERNAARRVADTPTDYWALYDLALIDLIRGEADKANQRFREAIDFTPAAVGIYYSVVARLVYLQDISPEHFGLTDCLDVLDAQIQRTGTR